LLQTTPTTQNQQKNQKFRADSEKLSKKQTTPTTQNQETNSGNISKIENYQQIHEISII